jgi:hypothetical protein
LADEEVMVPDRTVAAVRLKYDTPIGPAVLFAAAIE